MKKIATKLSLFILLIAAVISCTEEEMRYIDPMIFGVSDNADDAISSISKGSWNGALVGLKEQRLKLLNIKTLIETDSYTGENYTLENKDLALQRVAESIKVVEFKMDSVWKANIKNPFDVVKENSAGIQNFGLKTYNNTKTVVSEAFVWLMKENTEGADDFIANDLLAIQASIEVLAGLSALNDAEVTEFVNSIKNQYAEMKQQYAGLAGEVSSSPYFSKAQKQLYATIKEPLEEMETTLSENLSLAVKAELDAINRNLQALVYFVENNYTSPAQAPLVFGEISSITELRWLSEVATKEELDGDWVLTVDIDAAETARWNQDDPDERFGFRPIIEPTSINFDGQFHIISGLHMSKIGGAGDAERSGMFARIENGSIRNLGLINLRMKKSPGAGGGNQGGTLVGWISGSGGVFKCFVEGTFVGAGSQTGGFIGRPQSLTGEISDCFSVVDVTEPGNAASSSFIGLPVAVVNMFNCYNLGFTDNRAIFGHGSGCNLTASGIFYDSQFVGTTVLDLGDGLYNAATVVKLSDPGVTTDLPTADWGNLANFKGFSADTWEIRTETQFDDNPRPYLKGFNYNGIKDFIVVE